MFYNLISCSRTFTNFANYRRGYKNAWINNIKHYCP